MALALAEETAKAAAARAPTGPTGNLKRSLEAKPVPKGAGVYAEFYWFFVEYGSVNNQPPHPFITPAFEAVYPTIQRQGQTFFDHL